LCGRSLGVLGDGSVKSFKNTPTLVACRAHAELTHHHLLKSNAHSSAMMQGGSLNINNVNNVKRVERLVATPVVASLAQRRVTSIACGGWHTLVVTSGTHVGTDLRRPFEPGLNNNSNSNNNNNNNNGGHRSRSSFLHNASGLNKGLGHWASDLVLLVSASSKDKIYRSGNAAADTSIDDIVHRRSTSKAETKAIFCHQVVVRHRSAILAEKIRNEERRTQHRNNPRSR
jgi:hypothetical protein